MIRNSASFWLCWLCCCLLATGWPAGAPSFSYPFPLVAAPLQQRLVPASPLLVKEEEEREEQEQEQDHAVIMLLVNCFVLFCLAG